jgi:hypothetical protein
MRIAATALLIAILGLVMLGDSSFGANSAYYGDCTKVNVCDAACCRGGSGTQGCDAKTCPACTCHRKDGGDLVAAKDGQLAPACHATVR